MFSYEQAHQGSKFLFKQVSTFNIALLLKFVANFNFKLMSKPKFIVILTGNFCNVVASGTSHFYSFFSENDLARVDQAQAKNAYSANYIPEI